MLNYPPLSNLALTGVYSFSNAGPSQDNTQISETVFLPLTKHSPQLNKNPPVPILEVSLKAWMNGYPRKQYERAPLI